MTRDRRRPIRLPLPPDPRTGVIKLDDPRLSAEDRARLYREVYGEASGDDARRAADGEPLADVIDE